MTLLPGPDITNYLTTNSILLLDLKQSRNYVMLPSKAFFQVRMCCVWSLYLPVHTSPYGQN